MRSENERQVAASWSRHVISACAFLAMLGLLILAQPLAAGQCGNGKCEPGESADSCWADCGAARYCGDGRCLVGENCSSCTEDCKSCTASYCGDGVCSEQEDCGSCPRDCGSCGGCGDSVCQAFEDCSSCAIDCQGCASRCGDYRCDSPSEDCVTCPQDCRGYCTVRPGAVAGIGWEPAGRIATPSAGAVSSPLSCRVGKFNDDIMEDIVCQRGGSLHVFVSLGDGSFVEKNARRSWCSQELDRWFLGDFNGDGLTDLLCWRAPKAGPPKGELWVLLNSGNANLGGSERKWADLIMYAEPGAYLGVADFTGDRRDDVYHYPGWGHGQPSFQFGASTGRGFRLTTVNDPWCWSSETAYYIGPDLNSDQRADFICRRADNGDVHARLSNGSRTTNPRGAQFASVLPSWCEADNLLGNGDFNSDFKEDLWCFERQSNQLRVALSDGVNRWSQVAQWRSGWVRSGLWRGDFNGDGATDMLTWEDSGPGTVRRAFVVLANQQDRFANVGEWVQTPPWNSMMLGSGAGDFDGDGLDDLMIYLDNGELFVGLTRVSADDF